MADRDRFELDLAAALRTYLQEAPTEVRPTELARQFATDYPPGRTPISLWRFASIPRPAWVLLLGAALLAALLGGALLAGSQVQRKLPAVVPPVAPSAAPAFAYDVSGIAVAPDGSLWAATDAGIAHWNPATGMLTLYDTGDGLPAAATLRVVVGTDGTVWAGGSGWIARFDGSWTILSAPGEPMAVGPDGAVWTVVGARELARFEGSDWKTFKVPLSPEQGVAAPWTESLDVAADGTVWAGPNEFQGVFSFDGANWTHYTSADGLPARMNGTVAAAPDGTVWVGSGSLDEPPGAGVARFDGSTWTVYPTADGLLDEAPDVAVGADGTVWAIHQNGVSRFDGDTWTAFPSVEGWGESATVDASGTLWMPSRDGGVIGFDGIDITRLELPAKETETPSPAPAMTGPMTGPAGTWNPILATTRAKPAPAAATCPPDTDPATPGPADQERPKAGWTSNLAAAFDRHTGRIVYVDTLRETWTFDVCTNTWHRMNPTGAMIGELSAGLVYDVDSDLTVALGFEHISVYDANTNTWTQPSNDTVGFGDGRIIPTGAAYDPISGLILTTWGDQELWAYDVDTNDWTLIGKNTLGVELLGYSQMIDRLIFGSGLETTALVDPRTGEATPISTDTPQVHLVWPRGVYGPAADTVYVKLGSDVCGFDSRSLTWNACFDAPVALPNWQNWAAVFAAMVGDPINQRLILINGVGGDWWYRATDDVWAIDLDNGEWTQLLEPSSQ